MLLYTEKKAGEFLENEGFDVHKRYFVRSVEELRKIPYPCVMKVSGKTIVHKARLGGVYINVKNFIQAQMIFEKLKRIKGAEEVLIQELISGTYFILGIKKTPEFGHVLVFGHGGGKVEEEKDISFRVCPVEREDLVEMIEETKIGKTISPEEKEVLVRNLFKLCKLAEKYPTIEELDINPLMSGKIVDSRILFK